MHKSDIQPGKKIEFGRFGVKNGQNPVKPLMWTVLTVWDDSALLLCDCLIAKAPYHEAEGEIIWKDCSLRNWLNHGFVQAAFSNDEINMLDTTPAPDHIGDDDPVFILSRAEIERFLSAEQTHVGKNTDLLCIPSRMALIHGTAKPSSEGYWWARDIEGFDRRFGSMALHITNSGYYGKTLTYCERWIRPACRIRLR